MPSNEHPDMSGAYPDEDTGFTDDRMEDAFRAGAAQMREMLARFVEQDGHPALAQSLRLNWVPDWGTDPGPTKEVHRDLWAAL